MKIDKDSWDRINEITCQAIIRAGGVERFRESLGYPITKQAVSLWHKGKYNPSELTAWRVVMHKDSTQDARDWANHCLKLYSYARDYEGESEYLEITANLR